MVQHDMNIITFPYGKCVLTDGLFWVVFVTLLLEGVLRTPSLRVQPCWGLPIPLSSPPPLLRTVYLVRTVCLVRTVYLMRTVCLSSRSHVKAHGLMSELTDCRQSSRSDVRGHRVISKLTESCPSSYVPYVAPNPPFTIRVDPSQPFTLRLTRLYNPPFIPRVDPSQPFTLRLSAWIQASHLPSALPSISVPWSCNLALPQFEQIS